MRSIKLILTGQKNYSITYSIKKVNSKSPNNNSHFLKKIEGEKTSKIE